MSLVTISTPKEPFLVRDLEQGFYTVILDGPRHISILRKGAYTAWDMLDGSEVRLDTEVAYCRPYRFVTITASH